MKKIKLFSALALTMVMASCDNFDLPNPPGQTNTDPEAYFADADLELAPVSEAISLTAANQANEYVTVANITTFDNFPAEYTLAIDMEVGNDANFSKSVTLNTIIDGDKVTLDPTIINGAIQSVITKEPGTYDVNARFSAFAVKDNTRIRLGGLNNYYLTEALNVTTYDPDKVMEQEYYIVPCNAAGTPNFAAAVKMNNTAGNVSVYDNPEFVLKVEAPEGGYFFKVAPASVMVSQDTTQLLGSSLNTIGEDGKLNAGAEAATIADAGDYLITINVETESVSVSYAFEVLYPYSGSNAAANLMLLYTDNYINYSGVCEIQNQWFVGTTTDKSKAPLFKQSDDEEAVVSEDGLTMTGLLSSAADATQIKTPAKGKLLYWVDVNLPQLTYSLTALQTLSVIGSANDWSNDAEKVVDLTPSKDHKTWTATDIKVGPEFKINANHAWDIDFGGESAGTDSEGNQVFNITMKGGNLNVEEGTYDVTVNFSAKPYTVTLKKK